MNNQITTFTPEEIERAKKAQRVYHKQWREANADKKKAIQTRYWLKKAAEMGIE